MQDRQTADTAPAGVTGAGLGYGALVAFTGLMLSLNAFSNDILIPALFAIEREFAVPIEQAQASIPLFLLMAGVGQLAFGPVSDRFGRRPVLITGLAVYLAGTAIALLAPSITALHAGRMLQGFGVSCAIVVARAILRDCYGGVELARSLALAMTVFAIGPMIAPAAGVALMTLGSWRAALLGMALYGGALMWVVLFRLTETNRVPDRRALAPAQLYASVGRVLRHPQSRRFLWVGAIMQGSIVILVSNITRMFHTAFGVEAATASILFGLAAVGIVVGQLANRRLIQRLGVVGATRVAAFVLVAATSVLALAAWTDLLGVATTLALIVIFNTSFLVVMANAAALVLDPHREIAGLAGALFGFVTQASGSLIALATLQWLGGTLPAITVALLVIALIVLVGTVNYGQRAMSGL
jgi:DHA1 family bicyclomycin/chloramphenicol resistance-like MFS transporter